MKKLKVKYICGILTYPQLTTSTICRQQASSRKHPDTAVTEKAWSSFYKPEAFYQLDGQIEQRTRLWCSHLSYQNANKASLCKMHHRIKATRLSTWCCALNYSLKTGKPPCALKCPYINVSRHHKDEKNLSRLQEKLYLNRANVQLTTETQRFTRKQTPHWNCSHNIIQLSE